MIGARMAQKLRFLQLKCAVCNHEGKLSGEQLEAKLDEDPTIMNALSLYPRFSCSKCGSRKLHVYGDRGNILLDHENIRFCKHPNCDTPIPIPRLATFPNADTCPTCAARPLSPTPIQIPFPPEGSEDCPRCGLPVEVRQPKAGGSYFLGCSSFPSCWWRQHVNQDHLRWRPGKRKS